MIISSVEEFLSNKMKIFSIIKRMHSQKTQHAKKNVLVVGCKGMLGNFVLD